MDSNKKKRKKGPRPPKVDPTGPLETNPIDQGHQPEDFGQDIFEQEDIEFPDDDPIDISLDDIDGYEEPPSIDEVEEIQNDFPEDISILENEPPPIDQIEVELEYSPDRSYLYIFGPSTTGKTVLISSILYYLNNIRSTDYGDTLKNLNDPNKKHEREGNRLWNELSTTLFENKFPKGTEALKIDNNIPRHINAELIISDKNNSDFEFCFIDMSGEDLSKVNHDSDKQLPEIIKAYVESLPKKNICFTYILDPQSDFLSKSEQINIFNGFIYLLDQNGHTNTPLLFLVSKWDLVSDSYSDVEEYIKKDFAPIWGTLNQSSRNISFAEFSIGEVNNEQKLIKKYNPKYAEKVFNWFYNKQTGDNLITHVNSKKKKSFKDFFKK